MTREKRKIAVEEFKEWRDSYFNKNKLPATMFIEEVIKMLEQEPSEDCIKRQAVLDQTYLWSKDEFLRVTNPFDYLRKRINDLPSVNPQEPKTGHWISHREHCENLGVIPSGLGFYEWCSNCDCGIDVNEWHRNHYNYCPNCGCRMVEPQERSEE